MGEGTLEFGGCSDEAVLLPNSGRLLRVFGVTKRVRFKNLKLAPLVVVLTTKGKDGKGGYIQLPYTFSINGVQLEDKGFIIPPSETLEFTANNGVLTSVDGKNPELTTESYLILDGWLPAFTKNFSGHVIGASLIEAEDESEL